MGAGLTDFSNPASLLRRQRDILARIEKHKTQSNKKFDPVKILKTQINKPMVAINQRTDNDEEEKKENDDGDNQMQVSESKLT